MILSSGHSVARDAVKKNKYWDKMSRFIRRWGTSALSQVTNGFGEKEGGRAGSEGQLWPCQVPEISPPAQGAVEVAGEPHGACCHLPFHRNRSRNWINSILVEVLFLLISSSS